MIAIGKEIKAADGERMIFCDTAHHSNGTLLCFESVIPAGGKKPLLHYHPNQEETMIVEEGSAAVKLDGVTGTYLPGEVVIIPRGTKHSIWNAGDKVLRVKFEFRPALKSEAYFAKMMHVKGPLHHARLLQEYNEEIKLAFPFNWLMQLLAMFV